MGKYDWKKYYNKDAVKKYIKEHYKRIELRIRNDDVDIIEHIKAQENINKYMRDLIYQDITKNK